MNLSFPWRFCITAIHVIWLKVKALSVCCKYCVVFSSKPSIFILDNCSRPFQIGESTPSVQVYKFPLVKIVCIFSPAMFCPSASFWQERLHCPLHQKKQWWLLILCNYHLPIIKNSKKKLLPGKLTLTVKKKQIVYISNVAKLSTKLYEKSTVGSHGVSILISSPALLISHQLTQGLSRLQQEMGVKYILHMHSCITNIHIYIYIWDVCNILNTHSVYGSLWLKEPSNKRRT